MNSWTRPTSAASAGFAGADSFRFVGAGGCGTGAAGEGWELTATGVSVGVVFSSVFGAVFADLEQPPQQNNAVDAMTVNENFENEIIKREL